MITPFIAWVDPFADAPAAWTADFYPPSLVLPAGEAQPSECAIAVTSPVSVVGVTALERFVATTTVATPLTAVALSAVERFESIVAVADPLTTVSATAAQGFPSGVAVTSSLSTVSVTAAETFVASPAVATPISQVAAETAETFVIDAPESMPFTTVAIHAQGGEEDEGGEAASPSTGGGSVSIGDVDLSRRPSRASHTADIHLTMPMARLSATLLVIDEPGIRRRRAIREEKAARRVEIDDEELLLAGV